MYLTLGNKSHFIIQAFYVVSVGGIVSAEFQHIYETLGKRIFFLKNCDLGDLLMGPNDTIL